MKRRWLGIALGLTCVLAVALGYPARPVDEFTALRERFHPKVNPDTKGGLEYIFPTSVLVNDIRRELGVSEGLTACSTWCGEYNHLPTGRAIYLDYANSGLDCTLRIPRDERPWYMQTWGALKHRLGL